MVVNEVTYFVTMGVMGAIIYLFLKSEDWKDLVTFDAFKRLLLGAASGFIYQILYSEYNWPNSVMCIASGYLGTDFIVGVMNKFSPPLETSE